MGSNKSTDNRKVFFNYEILEEYEAGIELSGIEVKSLRAGKCNLEGAFITIRGREAFIINLEIPPYQANNTPTDYDPKRNRRILLTKKEIDTLANLELKKGLTIVPISVYNKGSKLKVKVAVVRGKKKFDKRETIKKRETDIEIRRTLKNE